MRIARIIEYFPPHLGGMERHGLILSQEQIKVGHEVDVFIGYGDIKLLPRIYKMPLQFLPLYSKVRRLWFNFWAYNKVKKIHKNNPYDLFHLHGDFVEAYFGGKLSKKLGIPAVLTIHAGLNKKHLKPANRSFFDNIKKIICVSETIRQDLRNIGVVDNKIEVISSGVYLNDFKNINHKEIAKIRSQYSKPIMISVGVLRINKGFRYLIEAFRELRKSISSATLLIIGDGPERENLAKLINDDKNVIFLGKLPYKDIINYLSASDIFVLASISTQGDREGTPTSIMEAMAAGLPVITTEAGGNSYLVRNKENGLVVKERSSELLVGVMIKLIRDEDLRRKMHKNNLEDIKQKDWPLIAKRITDVYKE